jgi:uncharacterized protein YcsI (UPF0317 family)
MLLGVHLTMVPGKGTGLFAFSISHSPTAEKKKKKKKRDRHIPSGVRCPVFTTPVLVTNSGTFSPQMEISMGSLRAKVRRSGGTAKANLQFHHPRTLPIPSAHCAMATARKSTPPRLFTGPPPYKGQIPKIWTAWAFYSSTHGVQGRG